MERDFNLHKIFTKTLRLYSSQCHTILHHSCFKGEKKDTDHSCRCSSRPPSFCTSCTHELGGSTELLSVTSLSREVATMTQCILFLYFLFYEEAQKESSLRTSNTVKLARERDLEAALAGTCDVPGVLLLLRCNVSTAAVSPSWGQREETFSH